MLAVASAAARRLRARLVSVDIGQLEDGDWVVIEVGDPQFSGLSFIRPRTLWEALADRLG
jgi:precorrin-6B methylase 1